MTPAQFCAHFNACPDGAEFAAKYKTMAEVWDACPRADWLLWILGKLEIRDEKKMRLFGCWCVRNTKLADGRTVWDLLTDERSRRAVEVAELFANGEASREELTAAARDAQAARYAAWAAAQAAQAAAQAAARDAAWAAQAAAWDAAWAAVRYAAWDSLYAARDAAWAAVQQQQADHLRTVFANPFKEETK